jgi:hypothetical protein
VDCPEYHLLLVENHNTAKPFGIRSWQAPTVFYSEGGENLDKESVEIALIPV